jgi:hypothetical protein
MIPSNFINTTDDDVAQMGGPDGGDESSLIEGEPSEEELEDIAKELAEKDVEEDDFYKNLAEDLDNGILSKLAADLIDEIDEDKSSRSEWINNTSKLFDNLGFNVQEYRQEPFIWCTGAVDTTMAQGIISSYATCAAELLPAGGPVRGKVLGQPDPQKELQAVQLEEGMNWYLTVNDKPFTPDANQAILWAVSVGNCPKKVYWDPVEEKVKSRKIKPQDFIVNTECNSILESNRLTHVIYLTKNEIKLRMAEGIYLDVELSDFDDGDDKSQLDKVIMSMEGIKDNTNDKRSLFECYEVHAHRQIPKVDEHLTKKKGVSLPYIITIEVQSKKILSIIRNWKEDDDAYKRKECFVIYGYLPGYGIYGVGVGQLVGSNAIALTAILRQLIDAGTLKNFPGGMRQKGLKIEKNDKNVPPGGFVEVETGGLPISDVVMLMPYGEPSVVLTQLLDKLQQDVRNIIQSAEKQIAEGNPNAPVGTTLALLETTSRVQTIILQNMHYAQSLELEMIFDLLGQHLPDEPFTANMPGKQIVLDKKLFGDQFKVIPRSDPIVTTSAQRLIRADSLVKMATAYPQQHDLREVLNRYYEAANVPNIDKILPAPPKPQGLDAVTENMLLMQGKPVVALPFQDHKSHIGLHKPFSQQMMSNPPVYTESMLHAQVHEAYLHLQEMMLGEAHQFMEMMVNMGQLPPEQAEQMMQGPFEQIMSNPMIQNQVMQSPKAQQAMQMMNMPLEQLMADPMIQNALSQKAYQEFMQQQKQMMEEQAQQPKPMDPATVMYELGMAENQQKDKAADLKFKETEMKTETEAYKVTHNFEAEKMKLDIQKEISDDKNQVNLEIAQLKQKPF